MKKDSGLDVELGNKCSKNAYDWAKKSFINRKNRAGETQNDVDGTFSNMVKFDNARIGISSDGIGTKIELAERTRIYNTIGFDLIAMVVDDLIANGFEPTNISNIIDIDYLDYDVIDKMMEGLYAASIQANITISGGEIAELGNRISGFGKSPHFNWCATAIGYLPPILEKPISGINAEPGDKIVVLKSQGFRSNGFSLVRKIMKDNFGENWHEVKYNETNSWGRKLLTPSVIYCKAVANLIYSEFELHGIAHITGGGLSDNLKRVLKTNNLGAELNDIYEPPSYVKKVQEIGKIDETKAYRLWNMGNGMLLVCSKKEADEIVENLNKSGHEAKICGEVTSNNKINIQTKGLDPQQLCYK
ncbi:MAG: AIR synthase-related protein [Candidatus Cloacimonadota bacterium]|nr:AIR synthase-related protein [Candidatus Cloacimonadota bacterium]